ncbi:MAG: winged helix-turn-helix domain-containing protein [Actinomycetota bacterium]
MKITDELRKVLAKPVTSPADAERAARAAEALAAYLRASERAEEVIREMAQDVRGQGGHVAGGLAGLTLQDAAEIVLERAGTPLHVKELGRRIKAGGWRHPRSRAARPDQINYQLAARLPRHAEKFKRVAPNTFALVKWDRESSRSRRRSPRVGLFKGGGESIGRLSGEHPEAPMEGSGWRSS